jgi:ribosomal protein S18 acetylase RimI-like enzyme
MELRRATSDDIPDIMAIERQPGYEALVGQWSAEQHAAHLKDPTFHYFVVDDGSGEALAFAVLHAQPDGLLLNRIIVRAPGHGLGRTLLSEIIGLAPSLSSSPRLWLRVAAHNQRAIHLYTDLGFLHEATLAAAGKLPNGLAVDLMVMGRPIVLE